ncbi:MAG: carbon storage regulator [Gemmataceae bacterium]|nr:carbon storage regulator [Gemmataceae bacterium]
MLVLSRKLGEKVCIGAHVIVTVVAVSGNRVRIGIEAPPHVPILRNEIQPPAMTAEELGASSLEE